MRLFIPQLLHIHSCHIILIIILIDHIPVIILLAPMDASVENVAEVLLAQMDAVEENVEAEED
jgi:hypothetical protein